MLKRARRKAISLLNKNDAEQDATSIDLTGHLYDNNIDVLSVTRRHGFARGTMEYEYYLTLGHVGFTLILTDEGKHKWYKIYELGYGDDGYITQTKIKTGDYDKHDILNELLTYATMLEYL